MDYTNLIGKEVLREDELWGKGVVGIVAQIDPDMGITIVRKYDHNFRLLCLINPDIYRAKNGTEIVEYRPFEEDFASLVDQIKNGFIENNKSSLAFSAIDSSHCAFT